MSAKSGYVFEKRLIEKFLVANGKCPITGVEMTVDDLIPLKTVPSAETAVVKPRTLQCTSIPTMIQQFQSEWDAAALEIFTLKRELKAAKEELAHALYTHDASCRVIARLVKERDELRALVNAGPLASIPSSEPQDAADAAPNPAKKRAREDPDLPAAPAAPAVEDVSPADDVKGVLKATLQELSKARKARKSAPLAAEQVAAYAPAATPLALGARDAAPCAVCAALPGAVAVGCTDGSVAVFGTAGGAPFTQRWRAPVAARSAKCVAACGDALLAAAEADAADVVALYDAASGRARAAYAPVPGAGRLCSLVAHPSGRYFVEARAAGSWALRDAARDAGTVVAQKSLAGARFACAQLHPDGVLLATAAGGAVKMWDLKGAAAVVASLDCECAGAGGVTALAFSENGYILATGARDGRVKIWDLRRVVCLETHAGAGHVLAVGAGRAVALLNGAKTFAPVKTLECAAPVAALAFSPEPTRLFAATSRTGIVDVFSP